MFRIAIFLVQSFIILNFSVAGAAETNDFFLINGEKLEVKPYAKNQLQIGKLLYTPVNNAAYTSTKDFGIISEDHNLTVVGVTPEGFLTIAGQLYAPLKADDDFTCGTRACKTHVQCRGCGYCPAVRGTDIWDFCQDD